METQLNIFCMFWEDISSYINKLFLYVYFQSNKLIERFVEKNWRNWLFEKQNTKGLTLELL